MKTNIPNAVTAPKSVSKITKIIALVAFVTCTISPLLSPQPAKAADKELPKAEDASLAGWKMSWVEPGPAVVLVTQEGKKPLEICAGIARAQKAGERDVFTIVGGAIKNGRVPSAAEAAADTSLSGVAKITGVAGYIDWKAQH